MAGTIPPFVLNLTPPSGTQQPAASPAPATLDSLANLTANNPTPSTATNTTPNLSLNTPTNTSINTSPSPQFENPVSTAEKEKQAFTTYEKKPLKKASLDETDGFFDEGPGLPTQVSWLLITIFGGLAIVFYYLWSYISLASQVTIATDDQAFVDRITGWERTVNNYVPLSDIALYDNNTFDDEQANVNLTNVITSTTLNYIHKRDLTHIATQNLGNSIVKEKRLIDELRSAIAEYGFFDQELATLMQSEKTDASIQESLTSLETVRFATAIKVFSFLDNFVTPFTRQVGKSREYVDRQLKLFIERGEVDVANYLKTCRNNPFEKVDGCNIVGDFRNYFKYLEQRNDFDIDLFLQLIALADQKLEEEQFPSLSLLFDRFDPNSQKLSFTVNVNTTSYDRAQLQSVGIFAPQVFIITNLVNLLKQSKFVLGSDININKLEVQKKNINVGGNIEQIFTSTMRFDLPLQKATQREIFDFEFKENIENIQEVFNLDFALEPPTDTNIENVTSGSLLTGATVTDEFTIESIGQ